ncbi:DUF2971 domain-containing protein [Alcanivorax sp. ZXX171]|nr:DUF2971 domain-containing protein [Alcanivorax sp. ZXX171]
MSKVWRYLTKEKLEWLVADRGLYFGPASSQSDPEEGLYDSTIPGALFEENPGKYIPISALEGRPESYRPQIDKISDQIMQGSRESNFLNSWYAGDEESMEMWESYAPGGVVIVSTKEKLSSQAPGPLKYALNFCFVKYNEDLKQTEIHEPLTVKNSNFSYEREFRIIFDARKYSMLTGYDSESYCEVLVGGEPSHESSEITAGMGGVIGREQASKFIVKKNSGYVLLYPLGSILTEVRVNPQCSEQHKTTFQAILSDAGFTIPVVESALAKNG